MNLFAGTNEMNQEETRDLSQYKLVEVLKKNKFPVSDPPVLGEGPVFDNNYPFFAHVDAFRKMTSEELKKEKAKGELFDTDTEDVNIFGFKDHDPKKTYLLVFHTNKHFNRICDLMNTLSKVVHLRGIDIAPTYTEWRNMGYALAHELGEEGRVYFHNLSQCSRTYDKYIAEKQYDVCLRKADNTFTISTIFSFVNRIGLPTKVLEEMARVEPVSNEELKGQFTIGTDDNLGDDIFSAIRDECKNSLVDQGEGKAYRLGSQRKLENFDSDRKLSMPVPTITHRADPDPLVDSLPTLLRDVLQVADSDANADMLLLGSLTTLSSCLPNVSGIYNGKEYCPNLFLFITAKASRGKGRLNLCTRLVMPVHEQLMKESEDEIYSAKLLRGILKDAKDNTLLGVMDQPAPQLLIIPANSSSTAVLQMLAENGGRGLIFETEGDTLSKAFNSEHGNFSDALRCAAEHEPIKYSRRKDREYKEIQRPCLSILLSGTPQQVTTLIRDPENGLFSRFAFYRMEGDLHWADVFANPASGTLDSLFDNLAQRFHAFHQQLLQAEPMRFEFTPLQAQRFNAVFSARQQENYEALGDDIVASVRRMGVITFRIAMILTTLRLMDGEPFTPVLTCSDADFRTAMSISAVLIRHTQYVFSHLLVTSGKKTHASVSPTTKVKRVTTPSDCSQPQVSKENKISVKQLPNNLQEPKTTHENAPLSPITTFANELPKEFSRDNYLHIAQNLNINPKTAEYYIKILCKQQVILHAKRGLYKKRLKKFRNS
jgi:hypothetical protein